MDGPLRLQRPLNYDFEQEAWRSRLVDIEADLAEDGPLSRDLEAVREIEDENAANAAMTALLERHAELLPGEGGRELATSIIRDSPPRPRRVRLGETWTEACQVDVFAEPVPPYTARTKRAGGKRYRARALRERERTRQILALLRGDDGRPRTHSEVARKIYPNEPNPGTAYHKELNRLNKQRGVRVRTSREQKIVAGVFRDPAAVRRRASKSNASPWLLIPAAAASHCTTFSASVLCAAGYERVRQSFRNEDGTMTEPLTLIRVPRALLVIDHEQALALIEEANKNVELSRFLETLDPT